MKMSNSKRHLATRILAMLLAMVIMASMLPMNALITAFAAEVSDYTFTVSDGSAVEGAIVTVFDSTNTKVGEVETGATGIVEFKNVLDDASSYTYKVSKFGYSEASGQIDFVANEKNTNVSMTALAIKTITGKVTTNGTDPVFKAFVSLSGYNPTVTNTETDADGTFSFSNVYEGQSYTLEVSKASYKTKTVAADLAGSNAIVLESKGKQAGFAFEFPTPVSIKYGDTTFINAASGGIGEGVVTYASSDESIATVNENGHITTLKPGTVTISAIKAENADYLEVKISYNLDITKTNQKDFNFINSNPSDISYGDPFANVAKGGNGDGIITYSSGDTKIATINENTGEVTTVKPGTVEITAKKSGNTLYDDASCSYMLTINKIDQADLNFETPAPPDIDYGKSITNIATGGSVVGTVTYSSSDETTVIVDENTGKITTLKAGKVTVTATLPGNDYYKAVTASYDITIKRLSQTPPLFEFIISDPAAIKYGYNEFENIAKGGIGTGSVSYSSSDITIATVGKMTGKITPVKAGEVTITATKAEDDIYDSVTAQYTIVIDKAEQTLVFEQKTPSDVVFGTDFTNIATGNGTGKVTYEILSGDSATVNKNTGALIMSKAGTVEVTATIAACDRYNTATATYSVTIIKAEQTLTFANGFLPKTTYSPKNTYSNAASSAQTENTVIYKIESGGDNISDFSAASETFKTLKSGSVTISATIAGDDCYNGATESYTLTINKAEQTGFAFANAGPIEVIYGNLIDNNFYTNIAGNGESSGAISYAIPPSVTNAIIADPAISTLTITGVGSLEVTATKAADDCYNETTAAYILNVVYLATPDAPYTLEGAHVNEFWFTGNVSVVPKAGYKISVSDSVQPSNIWSDKLTDSVTVDGKQAVIFYLRSDAGITASITAPVWLDKTTPTLKITVVDMGFWDTLLNVISFGLLSNKAKDVTIDNGDNTSGVVSVQYFKTDNETVLSKLQLDALPIETWISYTGTFKINADEKLVIYSKVTDEAGNYIYASSEGMIFDFTAPEIIASPDAANENSLYKSDVEVKVNVNDPDPFSGINEIKYRVEKDGIITQQDTLYSLDIVNPTQSQVKQQWSSEDAGNKKLIVSSALNNSNNVKVYITVTDNAGNVSTKEISLKIDITKPSITVSYVDSKSMFQQIGSRGYFPGSRTATIVITERTANFSIDEAINSIYSGIIAKDAFNAPAKVVTDFVKNKITYKSTVEGAAVDDAKHTFEVAYDIDANYTFGLSYTDEAGNTNEGVTPVAGSVTPFEFTVDKADPSNPRIQYDSNDIRAFLNAATFNLFFKDFIKVTLYADDNIAGLDYINYSYDVDVPSSIKNQGGGDTFKSFKIEGYTHSESFNILAQFKGKVKATFADKSGNSSANNTDEGITVDNISPTRTVTYTFKDGVNTENNIDYTIGDVTVNFEINEANFYPEDVVIPITKNGISQGIVVKAEDWVRQGVAGTPEFDIWNNSTTLSAEGDYIVGMNYTDRSGMMMPSYTHEIHIDKTDPTISIKFNNNDVKQIVEGRGYFNANRTATVTVVEHNFKAEDFKITIKAKDFIDTVLTPPVISEWVSNGDIHTASIAYTLDANYTVSDISFTDLAKRVNKPVAYESNPETITPEKFTVDKAAPTDVRIEYEANPYVEWLNTITFRLFFQKTVKVTVYANDTTSGLDYINYKYSVEADSSVLNSGQNEFKSLPLEGQKFAIEGYTHSASFDIPAQFKGKVTVNAYDKAKWETDLTGEGITVDYISPTRSVTYSPVQTVDKTTLVKQDDYFEGSNSILYFPGDIVATFEINEANFYKEDIAVGNSTTNGIWKTNLDTGVKTQIAPTNWARQGLVGTPEYDIWTGTTILSGDGDYSIEMLYQDRSTNQMVSYKSEQLTIDTIKPKITLGFDNNNVNKTIDDRGYFKADRTATITIVEHNFREDITGQDLFDVDYSEALTAKDGYNSPAKDVAVDDYTKYLSTRSSWKEIGVDTYQAVIDFDVDANYSTLVLKYKDLAENWNYSNETNWKDSINLTEGTVAPFNFTVDKVNPTSPRIQYDVEKIKEFLNIVSFNLFFKEYVKVTLYADDNISGLDYINYSYDVEVPSSKENVGGGGTFNSFTIEGYTHSASFDIKAQFRGQVKATFVDKSGNSNANNVDEGITVDSKEPLREVTYSQIQIVDKSSLTTRSDSPEGSDSILYFPGDIIANFKITEANFYPEDVITTASKDGSAPFVTAMKTWDRQDVYTTPEYDVFKSTTTFSDDGDYIIKMTYTDRSKNEMKPYTSEQLTIDTIRPLITIAYDNNDVANDKYFKANRTATLTINEHNFRADDIVAKVTAVDAQGAVVKVEDYANYLKTRSSWTAVAVDTYEAKISYTEEANYTFEISYEDLAKNKNDGVNTLGVQAPFAFTIDKTNPKGSVQVGDWKASVNGTVWESLLDTVGFGLWSKNDAVVKIGSEDTLSGIERIEHFRTPSIMKLNDLQSKSAGWTDFLNQAKGLTTSTSYTVEPDEQFIVYAKITDMAHNIIYISSDGVILDKTAPEIEAVAPEITVTVLNAKAEIYNRDAKVKVHVKIVDPIVNNSYSGLKTYRWEVAIPGKVTQSPDPWTFSEKYPTQAQLVQSQEFDIEIDSTKNDSNDVQVKVYAEDNSGNLSKESITPIKIDITPPEISVKYSNNNPDKENKTYFKEDRTATITVKERNFDIRLVDPIVYKNGKKQNLTLNWSDPIIGKADVNDVTQTATIKYDSDGDYKFDIAICSDTAGNKMEKPIDYKSSVAPEKFTIDKTDPVIKVDFAGEPNPNEYYKDQMTATVTITEHNFDKERVAIKKTGAENGKIVEAKQSEWIKSGDKYTATVTYSADGHYVFEITACSDKSGRIAAKFDNQKFIVDKSAPEMTISPIVNNSASKEDTIGFVIEATDNNSSDMTMTPKLTLRTIKDDVDVTNLLGYKTISEGRQYSVNNLKEDGIYFISVVLVDKAGNNCQTVKRYKAKGEIESVPYSNKAALLTFSVNRNGSTFSIDGYTKEQVDKYYIKNITKNIEITEINVDPLENEGVVQVNGTDLVFNKDFTITHTKEPWNKYVYSIKSELFAEKGKFSDEGKYTIIVSSKDKTQTTAFSDIKNKDAEISFMIDRSAPSVSKVGLDSGITYNTDKQTVSLDPVDTRSKLKRLTVTINIDNRDFEQNLLDWSDEKLIEKTEKGNITFNILSTYKGKDDKEVICYNAKVTVICEDEAGNVYTKTYEKVTVTTNKIIRYYKDKPLFFGSTGGITLSAAGLGTFLFKKRRKII